MCNAIYYSRFPFITSGIDLAKLDMRSGMERLMYALIIVLVSYNVCMDHGTSLKFTTCGFPET